jgi:hypothetical protein
MKSRTSPLLAGVILCLSLFVLGFSDPRVLPPASATQFSRLVERINNSTRLGATIRATGVAIEQSHAELSLQLNENEAPVTVSLTSPSASETPVRSRWFAISTHSDKLTEGHLRSLAALLDDVFESDPFIDPPHSTPEGESPFEHRKRELRRQTSMERGVLTRPTVTGIIVLLIAATGLTTWQVLATAAAAPKLPGPKPSPQDPLAPPSKPGEDEA